MKKRRKKETPVQGLFSSSGQVDNNKATNSLFNTYNNKKEEEKEEEEKEDKEEDYEIK